MFCKPNGEKGAKDTTTMAVAPMNTVERAGLCMPEQSFCKFLLGYSQPKKGMGGTAGLGPIRPLPSGSIFCSHERK